MGLRINARMQMTVEEYLHTSFENPDKEYRHGELVDRVPADVIHARCHGVLAAFFWLGREKRLFPCLSVRLRVEADLYLIPDVSVFYPVEPTDPFPSIPPLIAAEILSPEDRFTAVLQKLEEYRTWDVKHVWLVDPHSKRMYTWDGTLNEVATLRIPELSLEVTPADVFES
jgi:Uma2 family endonuclease